MNPKNSDWTAFFNDPVGIDYAETVQITVGDLSDRRDEARREGLRAGLIAARGFELGMAAFLDLTNGIRVSNPKLCPSLSRSLVSRWLNQVRRNLGAAPRYPAMARAGHKRGWNAKAEGEKSP